MKLNTGSARDFNKSLKKAIFDLIKDKTVRCEVINSYKFPNCYVRIWTDNKFPNELRRTVFDACKFDANGLLNEYDISYGNIQSNRIGATVNEWINTFELLKLKEA